MFRQVAKRAVVLVKDGQGAEQKITLEPSAESARPLGRGGNKRGRVTDVILSACGSRRRGVAEWRQREWYRRVFAKRFVSFLRDKAFFCFFAEN